MAKRSKSWSATEFRERFQSETESRGITAKKLQDITGIDDGSISAWQSERSGKIPRCDQIADLANAIGISPAWLGFGGTVAKNVVENEALSLIRRTESVPVQAALDILRRFAATNKEKAKTFVLKGMPEPNMKPFDTRADLPRYKMALNKRHDFTPVKLFENLAAGYGGGDNYEVMQEAFVKGVPRGQHTVAKVRGDSMYKTLLNGDYVLLKDFPAPGYELPQIASAELKTPLDEWRTNTRINHGDIVVVDVGQEEGKTLKRVFYDTLRGDGNWQMKILADNPNEWVEGGWAVQTGDHIIFYGLLVGLCEQE